jgi:hypothetical protein
MTTKPREISWAVGLFWASLAVAPVKMAMDWDHLKSLGTISAIAFNLTITIALLSFIVWKTAQGKNWGRIILLVFFALGSPIGLYFIRAEFGRSPVAAILSLLQVVMQGVGLWLTFTAPGKYWFNPSQTLSPKTG